MRALPERAAVGARLGAQQVDGARADAARRQVDDALEGGVIGGIADQAQIGQRILDLGALEEALAAIDAIRQPGLDQRLLEQSRLRRGAIEDGAVAARQSFLLARATDALDHEPGLVDLVEGGIAADRLAGAVLGPEILAEPARIVRDQRVGGAKDGAGGTIVLLQTDDLGIRIVALEALDILDPRATPAVDRLIVVADQEQIVAIPRQQPQPGVLDGIRILELVDQDVREPLAIVMQDVRALAQQFMRAQQQLGEVDTAGLVAGLLIGPVDAQHLLLEEIPRRIDVLRSPAFVLLAIDEALRLPRRPACLIQLQRLQGALDQPELIVRIQDLELLRQPGILPVRAQETVRQPMEGADPHAADRFAKHLLEAALHLARGLVGEGHGQDAPGPHVLHLQEPGDAMHQHPGLAGTGAGQHQAIAGIGGDGLALGRVQGIENMRDVIHRAIVTAAPAVFRSQSRCMDPDSARAAGCPLAASPIGRIRP